MGFFKKASVISRVVDPVNITGLDKSGMLPSLSKDSLLGKKDKGVADRYTELDPLQKKALGQFGTFLDRTEQMGEVDANQMVKQAIQSTKDAEMKAKEAIAQRGLNRSSVGLNALINSSRGLGERIEAIRANIPALQLERLGQVSGGINDILNQRMYIQGREGGGRSGGLLGLGLGAAGAYASAKKGGDPGAGFSAGQGAGRSIANF
jgi:hypothetical protein